MRTKVTAIFLALCLVFSLAACSSGGEQPTPPQEAAQTQEPSPVETEEAPQESSEPEEETTAPEETEEATEEENDEEAPAEEAVSEQIAGSYGLSVDEFLALKAAVQAHVDSEWTADAAFVETETAVDFAGACDEIRSNISEDFMDDAALESFIDNELDMSRHNGSDLWKERITVLAHGVNDWAAQQGVGYDAYSKVWDKLADYFIVYYMAADDSGIEPLFDLGE